MPEPRVTAKPLATLTEEEIEQAFQMWRYFHLRNHSMFEQAATTEPVMPGKLADARMRLFLSGETVAKKLGIRRGTYSAFEQSERDGAITIAALRKVAEAMECNLVYGLEPKCGRSYERIIWDQVIPFAKVHPWIRNCDQLRRPAALVAIVKRMIADANFRKKHGWSVRKN